MFTTQARVVVACAIVAASTLPAVATASPSSPPVDRTEGVVVQLFEWNWKSVARECEFVLGPAGFAAVQVSPAQEHVVLPEAGYPWWQAYQPVSYRIDSRKGDRAEFQEMVRRCHRAGVDVIADVVVNHMSGQDKPGTGSAGSQFSHYDYPGLYTTEDFHHCGLTPGDDIADYKDRAQVQNCELVNLSDLSTESEHVRDTLAGYLNDLLELGVDGFRVDAAKHVPAEDIKAVLARTSRPAQVIQEVIYGDGEPIAPEEYAGNGRVHEFRYARALATAIKNGELDDLRDLGAVMLPDDVAATFVDNHDTQRQDLGAVLTHRDGASYDLARAFMLAWPYGRPTVMSSYAYDSHDQGPPSSADGITSNTTCGPKSFLCEHRDRVVRQMLQFRASVEDAPVVNWWSPAPDQIAFSRGDRGFVLINGSDRAVTHKVSTGLSAGVYRDVLAKAGGPVVVSADGVATITVAPRSAAALHVGASLPGRG